MWDLLGTWTFLYERRRWSLYLGRGLGFQENNNLLWLRGAVLDLGRTVLGYMCCRKVGRGHAKLVGPGSVIVTQQVALLQIVILELP